MILHYLFVFLLEYLSEVKTSLGCRVESAGNPMGTAVVETILIQPRCSPKFDIRTLL